ncbi:AAA family ATPase [Nocardia huaxiensis]|uniref:AAA family ATPase n=1 Tax=Nocardia huaxiensis TaxID=2755382 RepID=A0A7D6V802_9NOCA|nr:AAA family ATPase [Nocardia huaxiensis]QLY28493.1 AAA family ATPase [Nocardia huaxiensis]
MPRDRVLPQPLVGRVAEQHALDRLLDRAKAGAGAALVLVGEPGIGKTALLDYAIERAGGMRVLRCRGVPSESDLAFAALHELLWPLLDRLDGLPPTQALALRGALGLGEPHGNQLLIGVAVLTLLADLAEEQPVLVIVDDLHLVDTASRHCLTFLARRTGEDAIAFLAATHPGTAAIADMLPTLTIAGLDTESAEQLVAQLNPALSPLRARALLRLTAGNPLALRELSRTATTNLGPAAEPQLELGPRLRAAFDADLGRLTPDQRTALLVTAAEDGADAIVAERAATRLGVPAAEWNAAVESGLMRLSDGRMVMRHPLIRAAVYDAAGPAERRAVHTALAAVFADRTVSPGLTESLMSSDPDRAAWHLAAAAEHPDEGIAATLDAVAERAWARGGQTSAARILRRAAALSPDANAAAVRLSKAARAAWDGGDVETARELLATAGERADPAVVSAAGGGLQGMFELGQGDPARARRMLVRDAESAEERFRAEIEYAALRAAWAAGESLDAAQFDALVTRDFDSGADVPPWRLPIADVAVAHGTERHALDMVDAAVERMRTDGPISWLGYTLSQRSALHFLIGRWDDALTDAAEALRLAPDFTGRKTVADSYCTLAFIAGLRGEEAAVIEFSGRTLAFSQPLRYLPVTASAQWSRGLAALSAERPDEAYALLEPISRPGDPAHHPTIELLAAADTIEAAVRSGRSDRAARHLNVLAAHAETTGADWAVAAVACSRALLEPGSDAAAHFAEAFEHAPAHRPFACARLRLLYGEWLRRNRRRSDAQEQLRSAHQTFGDFGAAPWTARAQRELAMAGDRQAGDLAEAARTAVLTPQELQVAKLAATGLTNRDIAARLLISPRTVAHHLSNVFPKLGLARREELARVDFERGFRLAL